MAAEPTVNPADPQRRPTVLIACPGLDHVGRGFETFARECFEVLRPDERLDVRLAKGSGEPMDGELVARTFARDRAAARFFASLIRRSPYDVEQVGFTLSLLPRLARLRPDLVFVSDWRVSRLLASWRARSRARFSLALSNGGPYSVELMRHADYVHQPTAPGVQAAVDAGDSSARHVHIPIGLHIPPELDLPSTDARAALRQHLGLPRDRPIVLSVAALNRYHKRVDYVIREIASMADRPFLLLLGADDPEAPGIRALAASLLGGDHDIRAVPSRQVADYYRAVDVVALGSTWEAFGKVMVEAMSHGLPCVAHDGPVQRWLLESQGSLGDLTKEGELARLISPFCTDPRDEKAMCQRHRAAYVRFSWDTLTPRYAEVFLRWCEPVRRRDESR